MEESIRKAFGLNARQLETYSPLSLAYVGDCFYELMIRTRLVESAEATAKANTKCGTGLASAVTQAEMSKVIMPLLSEEEMAVFKRGRNANTTHGAKNATSGQYRLATGFEALIGWLYLSGLDERAFFLVKEGWKGLE